MTLEQSIEGCKSNDSKSQKRLYELLSGQMYGVCLRYCKNESDAADVLQEGFIKVFKNIEQYRAEGNFAGWVRMIMVRTALRFIKKRTSFLSIDDVQVTHGEYEMNVEFDSYTFDKMLQHVKLLPPGYQTVFNLFVFEEFSHAEIAKELECTEATSRSQLFKARKLMQNMITKDKQLQTILEQQS